MTSQTPRRDAEPQRFLSAEEIQNIVQALEERDRRLREFGFDPPHTVREVLRVALPLPEPVLEIATGKGRFLSELARHVTHVTTVDVDPAEQRIARALATARGVASRIRFMAADATALDLPDHSFGSIISMNTFHHVEKPQALLAEMLRLVRPDGKVVISDFDEIGFEVMERVHAAEGRHHPRGHSNVGALAEFWRTHGWSVRLAAAPCQTVLIALGPLHSQKSDGGSSYRPEGA